MPRKIRSTSTFSLSFLDIMSCGLGAAVLIFLLLKHVVDSPTPTIDPQTMSEVSLLEEEIKIGEKDLVRIRNTISDISDETVTAQGLARRIEEEIDKLKSLLEEIAPDSNVDIPGLKNKIARLESQKEALEQTVPAGNKAYEFTGEGDRQYLTGLRIAGEHVLVLVDASASMLDEKIVNIIRRRNMNDEAKLQAPKWQRTQSIAQWILANLPINSDFQVLTFNTEVEAANEEKINAWYQANDREAITKVVAGINKLVPENGTNMEKVFRAAMDMRPRPDNIYLITDGLPTLSNKSSTRGTVSGIDRYRLFWNAATLLPNDIPINTLLLPLEGDPYAAGSFWGLALNTRGALVTPARGWP